MEEALYHHFTTYLNPLNSAPAHCNCAHYRRMQGTPISVERVIQWVALPDQRDSGDHFSHATHHTCSICTTPSASCLSHPNKCKLGLKWRKALKKKKKKAPFTPRCYRIGVETSQFQIDANRGTPLWPCYFQWHPNRGVIFCCDCCLTNCGKMQTIPGRLALKRSSHGSVCARAASNLWRFKIAGIKVAIMPAIREHHG